MNQRDYLPSEVPAYLKGGVQKGILTVRDAKRIEFFRKTRPVEDSRNLSPMSRPRFLTVRSREIVPSPVCGECPTIAMALAGVEAFMDEVGYPRTYNPLLVYGGCVSGRSNALSALVNSVPACEALILNVADLAEEFNRLQDMAERANLRNWLCVPTLLILEDIHLCCKNTRFQRELISSIASRIESGSLLVLTSDCHSDSWRDMEPALVHLATMGGTASVEVGTLRQNTAALRSRFDGIDVHSRAIEYLSEQIPHNCKRLWDVVSILAEVYRETGVPITLEIVNGLFAPPESQPGSPVTIQSSKVSMQSPNSVSAYPSPGRCKAADYKAMIIAATSVQEQLAVLELALTDKVNQFSDRSSHTSIQLTDSAVAEASVRGGKAADYKAMILAASNEQEQLTALEMALEDKLDQLYATGNNHVSRRTMTQVLSLVRNGKLKEAIEWIAEASANTAGNHPDGNRSSDKPIPLRTTEYEKISQ